MVSAVESAQDLPRTEKFAPLVIRMVQELSRMSHDALLNVTDLHRSHVIRRSTKEWVGDGKLTVDTVRTNLYPTTDERIGSGASAPGR